MNKKDKNTILVVDDVAENLDVLRGILSQDYRVKLASNGRKALDIAFKEPPDLILLDIVMPEMNGYEVCKRLKSNDITQKVPIIFVTAKGEVEDEKEGLELGAVDYITKPVKLPIVLERIKNHLKLVRAEELEKMSRAAVHMLGEAGHYNDEDTGEHVWRMGAYSGAIARAAGWSTKHWKMLQLAAPMHDTGKIGTPDAILKAPRKLTDDEWVVMKNHTTIGHSILSNSDNSLFQMAKDVALSHHEKWNGQGYPKGVSGGSISEAARIVAIADVFDALTMKRPYKKAWPIENAFAEIEKCSGTHFDPHFVNIFLSIKEDICQIKMKWDCKECKGEKDEG